MVKHLLFYDEPEAISGKMDAAEGMGDGNDADGVGFAASGPTASSAKNRRKDKTLKWMGILFLSTLLLLIFQVLLGWAARAVSLLADSGHSAADVVSYGFNLWIEWVKLAPALGTSKSEVTPEKVARTAKKLDTVGALLSLVILLAATWFSTEEAVERLRVPTGKDSKNIGRALLAYAIVSTAVSIGILVMYRRWHGKGTKKRGNSNSEALGKESQRDEGAPEKSQLDDGAPEKSQRDDGAPVILGNENFAPEMLFCPPCKEPPKFPTKRPNFVIEQPVAPEMLFCPPCKEPSEAIDQPVESPSDAHPAFSDESEDVMSTLHMIIHPGCTCSSKTADISWEDMWGWGDLDGEAGSAGEVADATGSAGQRGNASAGKTPRNLNLIAAFLHLITDILRSVLILIVAILIQLEAIQDAEHGDAVCGLVVAGLIFLGSIALMLQVLGRLRACCKRSKAMEQSKPTKSNENAEAKTETV